MLTYVVIALFCFAVTGAFCYMARRMAPDVSADRSWEGTALNVTFGFAILLILGLGISSCYEAYLRATTASVVEEIHLTSVVTEKKSTPITNKVGSSVIVTYVPSWHTDVTCEEYPADEFRASGKQSWQTGSVVSIRFYLRNGERIRYDLPAN